MKVNGTTVRLLPLDRGGGMQPTLDVGFLASLLGPGLNRLAFEVIVEAENPNLACPPWPQRLVTILPSSVLSIPDMPRMHFDGMELTLPSLAGSNVAFGQDERIGSGGLRPAEREELRALMAPAPRDYRLEAPENVSLTVLTIDQFGPAVTGDLAIDRSTVLSILAPAFKAPEPEGQDTLNRRLRDDRPGPLSETISRVRAAGVWARRLAIPGGPPLTSWLSGRNARAILLQPAEDAPDDLVLILSPTADPATVARAIMDDRLKRRRSARAGRSPVRRRDMDELAPPVRPAPAGRNADTVECSGGPWKLCVVASPRLYRRAPRPDASLGQHRSHDRVENARAEPAMNRRNLLQSLSASALLATVPAALRAQSPASPQVLRAAWDVWKSRHLEPSGRVVDGPQRGASHSEGQGYGLTLAALVGDEPAVLRIVSWTEANLAIRSDALLAWRWLPETTPNVPDRNNATDGDLFFAGGCLEAGRRFDRPALVDRATRMARAIARTCVVDDPRGAGRVLLLPAASGFSQNGSVVLNPSYNMPQLMRELGNAANADRLVRAGDDSLALLDDLAETGTTPDWIEASEDGLRPSDAFSDRTGYEAIRTPLFLIWSGLSNHPMVRRHRRAIASGRPEPYDVPTVFERQTGAVIERSPHIGYLSLAGLVECAVSRNATFGAWTGIPPFGVEQPYYPDTLHMMALMAQIARFPSCTPL